MNTNDSSPIQLSDQTVREGSEDIHQSNTLDEIPVPVSGAETARRAAMDMIRELRGTKCRCGSTKKATFAFCYDCFKSLPPAYQKALYSRMGSGYEEAYGSAVRYLKVEGTK